MTINVGTLAVTLALAKAQFERDAKTSAKAMENLGGAIRGVDGRLRDARGRFVAAGGAARTYASGAKEADTATGSLRGTFDGLKNDLKGLIGAWIGLEGARAAFRLSETAAQTDDARRVFENMGGSIEGVRRATRGLVADAELFRQANYAKTLGFTGQQFEQLAQVAISSSKVMGISVDDAFRRVVQGTAKMEIEILEEAGILAKVGPAVERYALAHNKTVKELTEAERRQAFFNEVVEQGNVVVEQANRLGKTNAERFAEMRASIENAKDAMGEALLPTMAKVADEATRVSKAISESGGLLDAVARMARGSLLGELFGAEERFQKTRDKVIAGLSEGKAPAALAAPTFIDMFGSGAEEAVARARAAADAEEKLARARQKARAEAEKHAEAMKREREALLALEGDLARQASLAGAERMGPIAAIEEKFRQQVGAIEERWQKFVEQGGDMGEAASSLAENMQSLRELMNSELARVLRQMADQGVLTKDAMKRAQEAMDQLGGSLSIGPVRAGVHRSSSTSPAQLAQLARQRMDAALDAQFERDARAAHAAKQSLDPKGILTAFLGGGASGGAAAIGTAMAGPIGTIAGGMIADTLGGVFSSFLASLMDGLKAVMGERFSGLLDGAVGGVLPGAALGGSVGLLTSGPLGAAFGAGVGAQLGALGGALGHVVMQTRTYEKAQSRVNELFDKTVRALDPFADALIYGTGIGEVFFDGLKMISLTLIQTALLIDTHFDTMTDKQEERLRKSRSEINDMSLELSKEEKRRRSREALKDRALKENTDAIREFTRELRNVPEVFKVDRAVAAADQGERVATGPGGPFGRGPKFGRERHMPISVGNRWSNYEPAN